MLTTVIVIITIISSSCGQQRGGRGRWGQSPHSDSDNNRYNQHGISRRQGVAALDERQEERPRPPDDTGGFWGQMVQSKQSENEFKSSSKSNSKENLRLNPMEQILPRSSQNEVNNALDKVKHIPKIVINSQNKKKTHKNKQSVLDIDKLEYGDNKYGYIVKGDKGQSQIRKTK